MRHLPPLWQVVKVGNRNTRLGCTGQGVSPLVPNFPPYVEVVSGHAERPPYPGAFDATAAQRKRQRLRIFLGVFGLSCLLGLAYTFLRPPIYRSAATLVIAAAAADEAGQAANVQRAAIQHQVLGGRPLLAKVMERLAGNPVDNDGSPLTVSGVQDMVRVVPVADTNLVELRAEGARRELLPLLVNAWVDTYLEMRSASDRTSADSTGTALRQQLADLELRLAHRRDELDRFRKQYDIITMERDENRVLARLKGLTTSLNKANEAQLTADANLRAMRDALAQGKPVVRAQDQAGIANLEQRAVALQEQMRELEQRFTPDYIALNPKLKAIPKQLELVEQKIRIKREEGRQAALAEAEQAVQSTRQTARDLERQLDGLKRTAAEFTTRFAEHTALVQELEQLELLYRDTKERLVHTEIADKNPLPEVKVLERASLAEAPVRPLYLRDAGISVAASLALGLFSIGLYEFFTRPPRHAGPTDVHPVFLSISDTRGLEQRPAPDELPASKPVAALEHRLPRELAEAEAGALLSAADDAARLLLGVLLSGLTLDEAAALRWGHVEPEGERIEVPGANARTLRLGGPLKAVFARCRPADAVGETPVWRGEDGAPLTGHDLEGLLTCAAYDAGVTNPSELSAQALRHTYLAFLVRQGVRLGELQRVAGRLAPATLAGYGVFSLPGAGCALEDIDLLYPALGKIA